MKSGKRLELEVRDLLDAALPACTLSSVCLFQPDQFVKDRNFGFEIDHLLHINVGQVDHLLLIECKAQTIQFRGSAENPAIQEWVTEYTKPGAEPKTKWLKSQLFDQAQSLLQNLFPREQAETVHLHGIVVSTDGATPSLSQKSPTQDRLTYNLISLPAFDALFRSPAALAKLIGADPAHLRPLRVQQSNILRMVRHGLIVPELGHPEVPNGMRYVARCRETLDCEITKYFLPTREARWVINGAAGMGKTVLLAYAATVFASGKVIQETLADRQIAKRELVPWVHETIEQTLPALGRRKVVLMGLNPKQCEVLNRECTRFRSEFQHLADKADDPSLAHFPLPVRVEHWRDHVDIRADVLLIDEAHDLSPAAQTKIRDWWEKGAGKRYLILACDRHQKLRLVGNDATILEGISFSGCSTRLTRNYRSPSPIYGAALALMFRWFGKGGTKIIPTQTDLVGSFGFVIEDEVPLPSESGHPVQLHLKNDCHPANYWSFTVARYTDWHVAYRWIDEWGLNQDQVLWVRFSHTDPYLDQQNLPRVQIRDLQVYDPDRVIDTHIKGREFPVVIIEGLPPEGTDETNLAAMLLWRRRLYLCASRATCFLFFVYPRPDGTPAMSAWNTELLALLRSCSAPTNHQEASSKLWRLDFDFPAKLLRPEVFNELEALASTPPPKQPEADAPSKGVAVAPVTSVEPPTKNTAPQPPQILPVAPSPALKPIVTSPVVPKPKATVIEITPAAPPMAKKDFQRIYGQEPGWNKYYERYLQTGQMPTHRPASQSPTVKQPNTASPAITSSPPPKPTPITASVIAKEAQASEETRTPQPKAPPVIHLPKPAGMTPRMISHHTGIKYFKVLRTATDIMKRAKPGKLAQLDVDLVPEVVAEVYQSLGAEFPTRAEAHILRQLAQRSTPSVSP